MKHLRYIVLFPLLLISMASDAQSASQRLSEELEKIWHYELETNPVMATSKGVHRYDDKLKDMSPEALQTRQRRYQEFLTQLKQIDKQALTRTEQITLQIQQRQLQNHLDEYRFKAHYMPLTSESGFHSSLAYLPRSAKFTNATDYQNYLSRLAAFPQYFEQQLHWMRLGLESSKVQPKVVLKGLDDSVASYFSSAPEQSVFFQPFEDIEQVVDQPQAAQLRKQALNIIETQVYAAYRKFHTFLQQEYIPGAKENIAAITWPQGKEYYQNRIRYYTTTDLTIDEIHNIGLEEVARIRQAMKQVVKDVGFKGDVNAFIQFLRTDPQFYAKTPEALLKHAAYYAKMMDGKLPKLFNTLPRTPYGIAPVPESIAPKYTTGRYVGPTRDDEPGYYWVNTYALDKRPLYAIPALTLHEAVPGHHLQNALASEMQNMPPVRRYTYISAFGEGWGLYSEYLGTEVGIYQDAYDEFGRLSYDMWRACRLVVDTGMHTKGWSRQQALDYMLENTALSEHNVRTEIDRYISWPAQALSYKIGEIEIRRLRSQAEKALGARFDIRAFHDAVLAHGSVPLSVLRDNIELFIQQQQTD